MSLAVVVTGSREWSEPGSAESAKNWLRQELGRLVNNTLIIHGGADGVDGWADSLAREMGLHTAVVRPLYDTYERRAPLIRNSVMLALDPYLVIAVWNGKSNGTKFTMDAAKKRNIDRHIYQHSGR